MKVKEKKNFGDGLYITASNYIIAFFLNTIYFFVCNLPLIIFYIIPYKFQITPESKYILIPLLIFTGPALTALYGSMGNIIRYGDIKFFYDFFISYKKGFKQSILVWIIDMFLVIIFSIDINYFSKHAFGYIFVVTFWVCIGVIMLGAFYMFPIISRFQLKLKDVIKLSVYYGVTKFKTTLIMLLMVVAGFFLFGVSAVFTVPFFPSVFCFLTMKLLKPVFKEIEEKIVEKADED
jgi:uncharacterized membrane protein YesL